VFHGVDHGVEEPNISAWRRSTFGDLTSTFRFNDQKADPPVLPDTAGPVTYSQYTSTVLPKPTVPGASPFARHCPIGPATRQGDRQTRDQDLRPLVAPPQRPCQHTAWTDLRPAQPIKWTHISAGEGDPVWIRTCTALSLTAK